jgi:hypothetical protein
VRVRTPFKTSAREVACRTAVARVSGVTDPSDDDEPVVAPSMISALAFLFLVAAALLGRALNAA